jgi:O-glycosyl hydrolase
METINKKIKIIKDGINEIIDMAEPTYIPDYESNKFTIKRIIIVTKEYDRRVDLISLAVYGSEQYSDIIMKCNELTDPLAVREGDIILIPELTGAKSFYINPLTESIEAKEKYIDSSKKSKMDSKRLQQLAKISASVKNGSRTNIKTNELGPNDTNITIDKQTNTITI